jgi:hypothetical protein
MSDSDRYYSHLPGGTGSQAAAAQPPLDPARMDKPSAGRLSTQAPRRGRQQFRSRRHLMVGAVAALAIGLFLLVMGPNEVALALQLEGTPGNLTVSSCVRQPDGKSYDYVCTGDFRATKGTLNISDTSYTSVEDLTGRTVTVQRGPDGGYYAVSATSAAMWVGFSVFGLVLVGMFLMYLPSFSRRIDFRMRPSEQVRAGVLTPAQRRSIRIGSRTALLALLVFVLAELAAVLLAAV